MRPVTILGTAKLPVRKQYPQTLRELGAAVTRAALHDAGLERVDALYLGNMLSDELQAQKHVAALVADEAGLAGIEALQVRAATATGAAALHTAWMAVAGGAVETAIAVGVEQMSSQPPVHALAKALDALHEAPDGSTLVGQNAKLMSWYRERYRPPEDAFLGFALTAHANANHNPYALFYDKQVTAEMVRQSRLIAPPLRLYDCAPICDGAAAVVLGAGARDGVRVLASAAATDRFRIADRPDPLHLAGAAAAAEAALRRAGLTRTEIDFIEVHDAFTIMACLLLEATGFARPGEGWRLAAEQAIALDGPLPISTRGGLKARGHPIGATALYQTCEIVEQLTGRAGANQVDGARIAMLQSVGGAGSTVLTHLFGV